MDILAAVRQQANEKRTSLLGGEDTDWRATTILNAARNFTGIAVKVVAPDHHLLDGGSGTVYRETKEIYLSNALSDAEAAFAEAHEFAHFWLETPTRDAVAPLRFDFDAPSEDATIAMDRVSSYSPTERREKVANAFALELLLPTEGARQLFQDGRSAHDIAREVGIPLGAVYHQLARTLLPSDRAVSVANSAPPQLDNSQRTVAEHIGPPLLVEAAPGTGKTRALAARIDFLIAQGVPPSSILALTFSNKAASELRGRVATILPQAAGELWVGTFHAFGRELVDKFGAQAGLAGACQLVDQAEALAVLEEILPDLDIEHYLNLHDPALELGNVLKAISRAKDELASPKEYLVAAKSQAANAQDKAQRLAAEKSLEVARIYARYESELRRRSLVDFGDLIKLPVEIFRNHPDLCAVVRQQYPHVLVDEFQDINRASGVLLRELAGTGTGLWVVGDVQQSIYRFRGASPDQASDFAMESRGVQRKQLSTNYRSSRQIVELFVDYARNASIATSQINGLVADRGNGESVDFNIASTLDAEVVGLADSIRRRRSRNAYGDQAVLCRVHSRLSQIAHGLEQQGIPVFYIGNIFERPEVRDLLALVSLAIERVPASLVRIAEIPAYRMPLEDVRTFLKFAKETSHRALDALAGFEHACDISDAGRVALQALATDLGQVDSRTGPAKLLRRVLFGRGQFLRTDSGSTTLVEQQRRIAIHQLLQFATHFERSWKWNTSKDPKRAFLERIRYLVIVNGHTSLGVPPKAAEGIDAVRLMTVHASKGLEFSVVHLPTLGKGAFPLRWRQPPCPLPDSLLQSDPRADQAVEEKCLFFVALSRAQDHLSLSRAQRVANKGSNPSEALSVIAEHLPRNPNSAPTWTKMSPPPLSSLGRHDLRVLQTTHKAFDIEIFLRCPRKYLYQRVLGLSRRRYDSGYVQYHRAVYETLRVLEDPTGQVDWNSIKSTFEQVWKSVGPIDHPLQETYRERAEQILQRALLRVKSGTQICQTLSLQLGSQSIEVVIDEVERSNGSVVLRRVRTGRKPTRPDTRPLHTLMLEAGRQHFGPASRFEIHYLTSDETVSVSLESAREKNLLQVRGALNDLDQGMFPAKPNDPRDCPRCPHYHICPALPE